MNLMSRLEKLEAEAERDQPKYQPRHIVTYGINYGDDVRAKRAEADAEFKRRNPDWDGPIRGERKPGDPVCLIELVGIPTEEGAQKHPDWLLYLDALEDPDHPENAQRIAAYEAAPCPE